MCVHVCVSVHVLDISISMKVNESHHIKILNADNIIPVQVTWSLSSVAHFDFCRYYTFSHPNQEPECVSCFSIFLKVMIKRQSFCLYFLNTDWICHTACNSWALIHQPKCDYTPLWKESFLLTQKDVDLTSLSLLMTVSRVKSQLLEQVTSFESSIGNYSSKSYFQRTFPCILCSILTSFKKPIVLLRSAIVLLIPLIWRVRYSHISVCQVVCIPYPSGPAQALILLRTVYNPPGSSLRLHCFGLPGCTSASAH